MGLDQTEKQTAADTMDLGAGPMKSLNDAFKNRFACLNLHRLTKIYKPSNTTEVNFLLI